MPAAAGRPGKGAARPQWARDTVIPALNNAVADAATKHGWTLVQGVPDMFVRHGYCSTDSWIVGVGSSFGNQGGQDGGFHPNAKGHHAYGERLAATVEQTLGLTRTRRAPLADTAPRLNAFLAAAANGSSTRMVDVNDPSKGGNRRSELAAADDGTVTETPDDVLSRVPGEHAAPDGRVDMRDLRRFRDAWLAQCLENGGGCPPSDQIDLNGQETSPKRDLNLDGCVWRSGDPDGCRAQEGQYARFDFNGDGDVSPAVKALVPWTDDGSPAPSRQAASTQSDLDVLRAAWSGGAGAEGWTRDRLDGLMRSGDLEVHLDRVFAQGATEAQVHVRVHEGADVGTTRTVRRRDGFAVMTVPVTDVSQQFELVTTAETPTGTLTSVTPPFTLKLGEDRYVGVCPDLTIAASPAQLPNDGQSTSVVTATVHPCAGREVADRDVSFTLDAGGTGATVHALAAQTDSGGNAQAVLTAGTTRGTATVEVSVDPGDGGEPLKAKVEVDIVPALVVKYVWRQTIEQWSESGSTRWTNVSPLLPDCTLAGTEYCIDSFSLALNGQAGSGLVRTGTLTGGGGTFGVTERVTDSTESSVVDWTISQPDGTTDNGTRVAFWSVADPAAYTDHPVQGVAADVQEDGLHVDGMQAVGNLPHHYVLAAQGSAPLEVLAARNDLLLIPQDGADPIRFAGHPDKEVVFPRDGDGFRPYTSCGVLDDDSTPPPGYYDASPSEYVAGALNLRRKLTYSAGDRPLPVGPRRLRVRYAFAAVAAYAGQPIGTPTLPDCSTAAAPSAAFRVVTADGAPAREGRQVRLIDASTDADNDIVRWEWDFGDGKTGTGPVAYHMFPDGPHTYTVRLTVTDAQGNSDTTTKEVDVANEPPEASIDDVVAQVDTLKIVYRILDPGDTDKRQLRWRLTSTNGAFPPQGGTAEAGVYWLGPIHGLPAGTYPLVLTVTDKDGATARAEAVATITAEAPPPPPPPTTTYSTCVSGVVLDSEEALFLDLVNDYRKDNGLKPVAVSGTLTRAAERHAHDMATHDFLAHTGSDGSSPGTRATDAGYPRNAAVGENISEGETALDVLWAWRGSTSGHNENMLNPAWKAIGIARESGSVMRWATSYGDTLDCPAGTPTGIVPTGSAPTAAPARALRSLAARVGADLGDGRQCRDAGADPERDRVQRAVPGPDGRRTGASRSTASGRAPATTRGR